MGKYAAIKKLCHAYVYITYSLMKKELESDIRVFEFLEPQTELLNSMSTYIDTYTYNQCVNVSISNLN